MTKDTVKSAKSQFTPKQFRILLVLVALAVVLGWIAGRIVPLTRYASRTHRVNQKIIALNARKPEGISKEAWEECVAWASIAHCNICATAEHTSYEALCKFENQLNEKLKEDVNLGTIEWIGKRLEETGPIGHKYMNTTIKWWDQWKLIGETIEKESKL